MDWRKPYKKGVITIKHGRKPSVRQCKLMQRWRLNPADWLVVKDTPEQMELVHRYSDKTRKIIPKDGE